ncbi:putative P-loop containing nucleoside triphosphate hydrolase, leucine-rich repeat domain superfamily [Helianthus anomalus]
MKMDSSLRPKTTLDQSAAAPSSFTGSQQGSKKLSNEIIVGFDHDTELIRDKLVEDQRRLDIVSIVGMGGIGKTTLATKVFNDGYVKHHFHVRVWVNVSQTYDKRGVLIQILESIRAQLDLEKTNDSRLRELVHRHLFGKRYLIVIDDIWHKQTWDKLKVFFPHDNSGSRILLTSRLYEVAKHANSDGLIHHLGYLNKEKSWELLCEKVFHGKDCPEWSIKPGMQIVENCQGLPLAVVVIAGVLAKEAQSENFWVEIAKRTCSYIVGDQNGCLETLALSYNHLPLHLRECFLYLGGFPEDYMFQVQKLIWLWVAEGFVQKAGDRSLEDIAESYMMDLIDRNLVMVADRKKSDGAARTCKVHDLVRELCLKKAKEEQFILQIERYKLSSNVITPPYTPYRMFIEKDTNDLSFTHSPSKSLRSFLCFTFLSVDIAKCFYSFVLLRVLDLHKCELNDFSKGMELLVHLRYLAIWKESEGFPTSICNLWNLQTLIYISKHRCIDLPGNISDLVNLRHLRTHHPYNKRTKTSFLLRSIEKPMNLQSISGIVLGDGVDNFQKCFPCIKELTYTTYRRKRNEFKSLTYLEKLKVTCYGGIHITFPTSLKTLTLEKCFLPWSDMSVIQSLPNLQVLKLKEDAFKGSCWNTNEQDFPQLTFLRLEKLDIEVWEAYSGSFPRLRQLEIICRNLKEIPLEIGDIPTLQLIKIWNGNHSIGQSVRRIQEEQSDFGNYDLKIDVKRFFW